MIEMASFTEAGGHPANEDNFVVESHPLDTTCYLCFLADGQGGRRGGGRASQLSCSESITMARATPPRKLANLFSWTPILKRADEVVSADPEAGFTTLIGFCVFDRLICGASSGDSAVLLVSNGGQPNEVTLNQIKNPPIGSGNADIVPFSAQLKPPWQVLTMSDGVWKYIGWDSIIELAKIHRGKELISALHPLARLPNNKFQDDFTLVVFSSRL